MCHLMINEHGMYHYTTVDEIAFLPMKCVLHTAQQDPTLLSSIITYLVHLSSSVMADGPLILREILSVILTDKANRQWYIWRGVQGMLLCCSIGLGLVHSCM